MKNSKEIVGNLLVVGGLIGSAGSAVDFVQNKSLQKELAQRQQITEQMMQKYGVSRICEESGCIEIVRGDPGDVYTQYQKDLDAMNASLPADPVAEKRGVSDGIVFALGESLVLSGILINKKLAE